MDVYTNVRTRTDGRQTTEVINKAFSTTLKSFIKKTKIVFNVRIFLVQIIMVQKYFVLKNNLNLQKNISNYFRKLTWIFENNFFSIKFK